MITVRPARSDDAPALLELIDALADYEKLPRPDAGARERLARDGFATTPPRFDTFLAFAGDTPVGYAICFETYSTFLALPTLYLEDFFVAPDARGQGAGDALFRYVCGEAHRRGCGRMEWVCLRWNTLAQGFYGKRGATPLDEWIGYRLTDGDIARLATPAEEM